MYVIEYISSVTGRSIIVVSLNSSGSNLLHLDLELGFGFGDKNENSTTVMLFPLFSLSILHQMVMTFCFIMIHDLIHQDLYPKPS